MPTKFQSIDEYIATFPEDQQKILQQMRETIQAAAPKAQEKISYNMPAFELDGNLVYFAGFKKHVGFFAMPWADEPLKAEMTPYAGPKGNLKFPHDQPLPVKLIRKIVKSRAAENKIKAKEIAQAAKKKKITSTLSLYKRSKT